jgi:hypothetical protein
LHAAGKVDQRDQLQPLHNSPLVTSKEELLLGRRDAARLAQADFPRDVIFMV